MADTVETAIYKLDVEGKETVDAAAASVDRLAVAEDKVTRATRTSEAGFARLRASLDPAVKARQQYERTIERVNRYEAEGIGSTEERTNVVHLATRRYQEQVAALGKASAANENFRQSGALAQHEVINLSRQLQDVGVSLLSGQSPFTVLAQQGTQVADIFASSQGTVGGFFRQTLSWIGSIVTPARLAVGALAGIGIAAVTAALQWASAQRDIAMALTGIGRASGATVGSINAIAEQTSSAFGLSRSEAREFATQLAATGKVANDNIPGIVSLGKDIARVFGVDAVEAARMVAKAYADPGRGAEELNQRLGAFDAATVRNITNLQAQNRLLEAQRLITTGIRDSVADVNQQVTSGARFWTAIGNAISNAWDTFGQFASRTTGIGFTEGLDEQLERTRGNVARLEQQLENMQASAERSPAFRREIQSRQGRLTEELARERAELERLTGAWAQYWQAVSDAQTRRDSFVQASAVRNELPELADREGLQNQVLVLGLVRKAAEQNDDVLKRMGITWDQLGEAIARASAKLDSYRTATERADEANQLALRSITAFSPAQRADLAYQEAKIQYLTNGASAADAERMAEQRRAIALAQGTVALTEAARERRLAAEQSVQSAQLEIQLIGRSIEEQTRLRADLQARQQLEQEAARNRTAFDQAEFERLQKINAELGRRAQLRALADIRSDAQFERDTMFLSQTDQSVAQRLRPVFGNDVSASLRSAEADILRFNANLRETRDLAMDVTTSFARDFTSAIRQGASAMEAFQQAAANALNKIADKLIEMAAQQLVNNAFGGAGGLLSLFGGGGGGGGYLGTTGGTGIPGIGGLYANGAAFNHGNVIPFARGGVVDRPTLFPFANGAGLMGEAGPEAIMPLRRGSDGKLGVQNVGGGGTHVTVAGTTIVVQGDASEKTLALIEQRLAQRDRKLPEIIISTVQARQSRRVG
ncbi:MAG: hypothetical protein GEU95_26870 [Rhizobiales bacterium]|nr:hypothetical protein [Hyphomicrobiales bacterium]